jgi:hypothetical protein
MGKHGQGLMSCHRASNFPPGLRPYICLTPYGYYLLCDARPIFALAFPYGIGRRSCGLAQREIENGERRDGEIHKKQIDE